VDYVNDGARAEIALDKAWHVAPTNTVLERLRRIAGEDKVRLVYPPRTGRASVAANVPSARKRVHHRNSAHAQAV